MSFLSDLTSALPFGKKAKALEHFFALNIASERLVAALWTIEDKQLKILETASESYASLDELISVTDKLLDAILGTREAEPQKILFGVPSSWLADENLKGEYLKILRSLVKELELTPMAYVETTHALVHFLEKQESVPPTAILVGFEGRYLTVTVVRAGKIDGVKVVSRGEDSSGSDIEKALLTFTGVETLPSKIFIYGPESPELKNQLLSFSWMSKLSFLHFPKIESLQDQIEIKSICLAGASELDGSISYTEQTINQSEAKSTGLAAVTEESESDKEEVQDEDVKHVKEAEKKEVEGEDFGFMVGDIAKEEVKETVLAAEEEEFLESDQAPQETKMIEVEDFEHELPAPSSAVSSLEKPKKGFSLKKFIPKNFKTTAILLGVSVVIFSILGALVFLPKAEVKIFVEPKVLERDTQATADPNQKLVDENSKIIPGQLVDVEVSGSSKASATGKKQIGDPAKGTILVYNKTFESQSLSKGTQISGPSGVKFTLDTNVTVASQSAAESGITFGKTNATVTASTVGADGNLPSGTQFAVANHSSDKLIAKAEGNFSGGTSKEVTVVSSDDQQRLLASLTSDLRKQAQQKLQDQLPEKKILEEALSEEIVKKSFNKNINDQASEFSLNLTAKYKGTAFEEKDLRLIVSRLVTTQVPDGFKLNLEDTEVQADVSKLEKDGKLIFLARFKAKLLPKIDTEKVKKQIQGKSVSEAITILKGMENILGAEIKTSPALPQILQRVPIIDQNIRIEVGLK